MDCIVTIDIETTMVKILAFTLAGKVIVWHKGSYPTFHPQPDYSEQDPEQVFITVLYVLKNLLNDKKIHAQYKVAAICFSSSMHSILPVDKSGIPLGNAIIWADNRGREVAEQLKKMPIAKQIYETTGTPIHPMSPLIKISWLKNHDKERFKKTFKFLSLKEYVIQQLTGDYIIDQSLASATGLFDSHQLKWCDNSLYFAGISPEKLSQPVSVFESSFKLRREYSTTLGLPADTKLIIGASDGCLATLGAGVIGEGKATITIGSSGAVRVAGKEFLRDAQQRFFNYFLTDNYFISGGPTNNGGVVFDWFTRQFGTFNDVIDFEDSMNNLLNEASKVQPGANGLLFLPYLLGERAPLWNANARGMYFGMNITHEQRHFVRATIEGILFEIYSIGKLLEKYRNIDTIFVNGTFGSLPLWSQILADMFGKSVSINDNHDSANMGAALLSLTEIGVFKSLAEATKIIQSSETYHPNEQNHGVYMKYFDIFESLSHKLSEEFDKIVALQ